MSNIFAISIDLIPFILIVVLNVLIYKTIQEKGKLLPRSSIRIRRDFYVATILIIIICMYAMCHSFKVFLNVLEITQIITGLDNGIKGLNRGTTILFSAEPNIRSFINFHHLIHCLYVKKINQGVLSLAFLFKSLDKVHERRNISLSKNLSQLLKK